MSETAGFSLGGVRKGRVPRTDFSELLHLDRFQDTYGITVTLLE